MSDLNLEALVWRKATASFSNGQCVEVAAARHPLSGWAHVLIRDSKRPDGERLAFIGADWSRFVAAVKAR